MVPGLGLLWAAFHVHPASMVTALSQRFLYATNTYVVNIASCVLGAGPTLVAITEASVVATTVTVSQRNAGVSLSRLARGVRLGKVMDGACVFRCCGLFSYPNHLLKL
jgi:hypothetical protein